MLLGADPLSFGDLWLNLFLLFWQSLLLVSELYLWQTVHLLLDDCFVLVSADDRLFFLIRKAFKCAFFTFLANSNLITPCAYLIQEIAFGASPSSTFITRHHFSKDRHPSDLLLRWLLLKLILFVKCFVPSTYTTFFGAWILSIAPGTMPSSPSLLFVNLSLCNFTDQLVQRDIFNIFEILKFIRAHCAFLRFK